MTFADYDAQGRTHTVTDAQGTRTLSYATGGALSGDSLTSVSSTYANGRITGLNAGGYDAATGRFNTVTYQPGTAEQQTFNYGYLPNSNLLSTVSGSSGFSMTRAYEPHRDVVTRVQNRFGSDVVSQYDYVYDALRRRASMITSGPAIDTLPQPTVPEENISYSTNNLNQYTNVDTDGTDVSLDYDLDGSLTNDGRFQYVYNAENRMITATPLDTASGLQKVEAEYDYLGRRILKKTYTYTAGVWTLDTTTTFVYDGWNVIQETSTPAGGSASTVQYVWGLDLSGTLQGAGGIGGLLLRRNDTGTFAYLYDANGNVGQLVNVSTGDIAARYTYDPFGVLLVADGPEAIGNPYRFSTKYFIPEIGWYDYGMRPYSPQIGRWPTRDPIGEKGGLNLYGFVGNDSVNHFDILGLACGNRLTREEAEQLTCAINTLLSAVPLGFAIGAHHLLAPDLTQPDIAVKLLVKYMSREGGRISVPYKEICNNKILRRTNTEAEQILRSGKQTYTAEVSSGGWDTWGLDNAINRAILRYTKLPDDVLSGSINEPYTFLDDPDPNKILDFMQWIDLGVCCWKCGVSIKDSWMADLEIYGFAKTFTVQAEWRLPPGKSGADNWEDYLEGR